MLAGYDHHLESVNICTYPEDPKKQRAEQNHGGCRGSSWYILSARINIELDWYLCGGNWKLACI
jgi:hypothetical protein